MEHKTLSDTLACPKCMKMFLHYDDMQIHIREEDCKPVSIFNYLSINNDDNIFSTYIQLSQKR